MVTCLACDANDLHMVQLMSLPPHHLLLIKILIGLTFLVLAYPGCSGKVIFYTAESSDLVLIFYDICFSLCYFVDFVA